MNSTKRERPPAIGQAGFQTVGESLNSQSIPITAFTSRRKTEKHPTNKTVRDEATIESLLPAQIVQNLKSSRGRVAAKKPLSKSVAKNH